MQTNKTSDAHQPSYELVDCVSVPQNKADFLFAALLLTAIGVFIGGNVLLLDITVLCRSVRITLPCLAVLTILYATSRVSRSVSWGLVLTYGAIWIMVYSRQAWLIPVMYGVALIALVYLVRFLRVKRAQWSLLMSMAVIASATILSVPSAYTSFDMMNRLHAGNVHQDTLFHASIAAMIKNYGVASTGLHGLLEVKYHVMSHALIAGVSLLSGAGVRDCKKIKFTLRVFLADA